MRAYLSMIFAKSTMFVLIWGFVLTIPDSARANFTLDFSVNGALPSAQGFVYGVAPGQTYPENPAFNVSGGLLHLDTVQFAGDKVAYYEQSGTYSHLQDAEMIARVRVTEISTFFGLSFAFYDSVASGIFTVRPTGWTIEKVGTGTFTDTQDFREFRFKALASGTYTFSVDGVVVSSGIRQTGYLSPSSLVYFGDGTPTGGNVKADIAFVQFNTSEPTGNPGQAVPVPPTLLTAVGIPMLVGLIRRRRRDTISA